MDQIGPMSRAKFTEITDAMRSERKKASPEFQSIPRNNRLLREAYMQVKDGAEPRYTPKMHLVESKIARDLTINSQRKVFGKTPIKIPPACVADQDLCSLEKRMRISKLKKAADNNERRQRTLNLALNADGSPSVHDYNESNVDSMENVTTDEPPISMRNHS